MKEIKYGHNSSCCLNLQLPIYDQHFPLQKVIMPPLEDLPIHHHLLEISYK